VLVLLSALQRDDDANLWIHLTAV